MEVADFTMDAGVSRVFLPNKCASRDTRKSTSQLLDFPHWLKIVKQPMSQFSSSWGNWKDFKNQQKGKLSTCLKVLLLPRMEYSCSDNYHLICFVKVQYLPTWIAMSAGKLLPSPLTAFSKLPIHLGDVSEANHVTQNALAARNNEA